MKNKFLIISFLLFIPFLVVAKTTGSGDSGFLTSLLGSLVLAIGGITFFAAIASLIFFDAKMLENQEKELLKAKGISLPEPEINVDKPSVFTRFYDWMAGLKPVEEEKDIMLDHDYDGIQELDNSLPPWWLAMFYITVIIGPIYIYYYHMSNSGVLQKEEYEIAMRQAEQAKIRYLAKQTKMITEKNVTVLSDPGELESGKAIYIQNCVACHGQKGEGGIGPNMTDDYWLHGGDIKSVFKTIKYGVPEKGMIAWKAQLPPSQIHQVASYIMTLHGTNPPNGKEPQGELFVPEGASQDSTGKLSNL